MADRFQSGSGKPYSEQRWLENHHSIKSRLRTELIRNINIGEGQHVLDVGCGTGVWVFSIADQVGHNGSVLGIDTDEGSLVLAEAKRSTHHHRSKISFKHCSLSDIEVEQGFDVVTAFNCLCYIEQVELALAAIQKLLKPGGMFVAKDSDLGSDFFWPVDRSLYQRLLSGQEAKAQSTRATFYDPFFARKLPGLLKKSGFVDLRAATQSFSFIYPVDPQQRMYIKENGLMIPAGLENSHSVSDINHWRSYFDEKSAECIFDKADFLYSMTEFVFQARAPSNS